MNHAKLIEELQAGHKPLDGLTLHEMRYLSAYTTARIEIEKQLLTQAASNILHSGSIDGKPNWASRILRSFSYFDYFLLAFKAIGLLRGLRRK